MTKTYLFLLQTYFVTYANDGNTIFQILDNWNSIHKTLSKFTPGCAPIKSTSNNFYKKSNKYYLYHCFLYVKYILFDLFYHPDGRFKHKLTYSLLFMQTLYSHNIPLNSGILLSLLCKKPKKEFLCANSTLSKTVNKKVVWSLAYMERLYFWFCMKDVTKLLHL